jgi:CBS domain-containing protein
MIHRAVRAVMTADVAAVTEDTPFTELVSILARRGVSALPVLTADGRVAGVVSEIDLLRKEEYQDDPSARQPPRWRHRESRARAAGLTAKELMTSPPVTITQDASVIEAARELDRHHVRHLIVTDGTGRLAGIVTPRDLLKVYLRSDDEIRDEIVRDVITKYLGTDPARVKVAVADGVVTMSGEVEHKSMVGLAVRMAASVDGVVHVAGELAFAVDDDHVPPALDAPDR